MKKLILLVLSSLFLATGASASIILQTQANTMGMGLGVGFSMPVIPILMDMGIEANTGSSPWSLSQDGSYTDETTKAKVNYDGTVSWKGTRYGIFAKFNLPFISPIIHAGTQQGRIGVDGSAHFSGMDVGSLTEDENMYGSYISLGLPFYIGPVFVEPSFGTQSLFIPHYLNVTSFYEVQLAIGISLL